MKHLIVLTGASGTGKTMLAEALAAREPDWCHIHPDGLWDTPSLAPDVIFERVLTLVDEQNSPTFILDCQVRAGSIEPMIGSKPTRSWHKR